MNPTIYLARCNPSKTAQLELLAAKLHPMVQLRISKVKSTEAQNQIILGRALLSLALIRLGAAGATLTEIGALRSGAPDLPNGFVGSIAHTDGLVAATAANGQFKIGIDIEHSWLSCRCPTADFCPAESPDTPSEACIRRWTISEALAKASGRSLSDVIKNSRPKKLSKGYSVRAISLSDGYYLSVASSVPFRNISFINVEIAQLLDAFQLS